MVITQRFLLCTIVGIVSGILPAESYLTFCIFGAESNCLLPCRCSSPCDKITGRCSNNQCAEDLFLKDQALDGRTYWTGDACQTGNVGRGKRIKQAEAYHGYGYGAKVSATADQAVDGSISSYAHSRSRLYGWWRVDLEIEHVIEQVYITANHLGESAVLLTNYSVWIGINPDVFSHNLCGLAPSPLVTENAHAYSSPQIHWNKVVCSKEHRRGRYVSIRKTENDETKGDLRIHKALIIGYPISSVRLGYCIRYNESFDDDLQNLKCEECAQGWLLPDCKQSSLTTTTGYTTTSLSTEAGVATWVIIASTSAALSILLLVAVVIIIVTCCSRQRFHKSQDSPQTIQRPIYFKPDDGTVGARANNYEGMLRQNPSLHKYTSVRPSDAEDGSGYQTIQTDPVYHDQGQYVEAGLDTYNCTSYGYLKPVSTGKVDGYIEVIDDQSAHNNKSGVYHTIPDNGVKNQANNGIPTTQ